MIKYDSEICDNIVSNIKAAGEVLNSDIASKILNDYSALTGVGLFSSQLSSIKDNVTTLIQSFDSFTSVISESKSSWASVQEESKNEAKEFDEEVDETDGKTGNDTRRPSGGSGSRNNSGSYGGGTNNGTPSATSETNVSDVSKGKKVSTNEVKELLAKVDSTVMPILIKKMNKLANGQSIVDLLVDKNKSNILTTLLKKILGDTTNEEIATDLDTEAIQKILLSKLSAEDIDISTEEGKSALEKKVLEQMNTQVDESKWNELLYGDNTTIVEALDGRWVVAKTAQDVGSYVSYIQSNGVKQDANTAEWGDSCLAFAGAHTYDLYKGTHTNGESAAAYAYAGSFTDYIDDDKQGTLSKIYDEIMSGRPMVLQVNGNKAGTSRHFVTVVGFKEGVVSGSTLQESDLLIIDSWDGKLERMDTETSRFMTTGAACHKDYSGYRLRVFKS